MAHSLIPPAGVPVVPVFAKSGLPALPAAGGDVTVASKAGILPIQRSLPAWDARPASPQRTFSGIMAEPAIADRVAPAADRAAALPAAPVAFKTFAQLSSGLHPDEVKNLQTVFDGNKIIDLEESCLTHLRDWLECLNERLTAAVEKTGEYYPEYRISVMEGDEPQAFVYKFRSPGQKFYRGHVFFSAGLVRKMAATILKKGDGAVGAADIGSLNDAQIEQLMKGIQGAIGHEFAHPKQDELIKWQWRESQDQSRQTHGQADEMTTDLLGIKLLKDAELEPSSLLTGLELLFGYEPSTGHHLMRGAMALASSHPEEKLRLNILRGGLVRLRRDEGKNAVRPLDIDAAGLISDLSRIVNVIDPASKLAAIEADAKAKGEPVLIRFANEMLTQVIRTLEEIGLFGDAAYGKYLDWMDLLAILLKKNPEPSEVESQALVALFQEIKKYGVYGFSRHDSWMVRGKGGSDNPQHFPIAMTRRAQKMYATHPLFALPAWEKRLQNDVDGDLWEFTKQAFHYLGAILPRARVLGIYETTLTRLDEIPVAMRIIAVLEMLQGFEVMGGPAHPLELELVKKLRELSVLSEEAAEMVSDNLHNIFPDNKPRKAYYLERFLRAGEGR